jgi:hypothetical protein
MSPTIIGLEPISPWGKTRRRYDACRRRRRAPSSRSQKWADYITATNDARPDRRPGRPSAILARARRRRPRRERPGDEVEEAAHVLGDDRWNVWMKCGLQHVRPHMNRRRHSRRSPVAELLSSETVRSNFRTSTRRAQVNRHRRCRPVIYGIMHENHERTSPVTVHRAISERPVNVRHSTSAAAGRSIRRMVSREHTLHDQVRNLRMALFGSKDPSQRPRRRIRARVTTLFNETDV